MAERVLAPTPSLVKYYNPVLVIKRQEDTPVIKVKLGPGLVTC